ncbi:GatB/YqeY domain-containing protein [Oceanobacillus alkalisoli]|uniref:GatB/YqeY domain-containing protein n=1 Tax=Oceanobacillus alkalisoli TaxID=2925113 RepID=UPI001EF0F344|nr:GatB/YqeY domain-containing protein [Oceanobacillus alkalisoli]MCF3941809.1 GatB/YqeY domain-containing protein [Oceanobacillus alkalisoli]MCG5103089.1 GatB/YqeY domain-containing protein [Oceanobacillus alkalisoli]
MALLEKLNQAMIQAMKKKDKDTLNVVRMVKASIQNELIKLGKEHLSEDEELTILSRELKQRKESLQEFTSAGRTDLAEKVQFEIEVLEQYMPKQLSKEEMEKIVEQAIREANATSMKDIGKIMGKVIPLIKGKADGSHVKQIVEEKLK